MKSFLKRIFNSLLSFLNKIPKNTDQLIETFDVIGCLDNIYSVIAIAILVAVRSDVWLPVIVFGAIGYTGFTIAVLDSDHAVIKISGGLQALKN